MKKALTVGELLITMSIIGVIAILVLPGFMKDYHNKVYTTKLKKSIEIIENAVNQACIDNNVSYFYQTPYKASAEMGNEFLHKYFKVGSDSNVFAKYTSLKQGSITNITDNNEISVNPSNAVKLLSGEAIGLTCPNNKDYCTLYIDINSTDAPNKGGRDMFVVYLDTKTNEIKSNIQNESIIPSSSAVSVAVSTCETSAIGAKCYGRLIENNWVMDY